jgi:hypothetical protein
VPKVMVLSADEVEEGTVMCKGLDRGCASLCIGYPGASWFPKPSGKRNKTLLPLPPRANLHPWTP